MIDCEISVIDHSGNVLTTRSFPLPAIPLLGEAIEINGRTHTVKQRKWLLREVHDDLGGVIETLTCRLFICDAGY